MYPAEKKNRFNTIILVWSLLHAKIEITIKFRLITQPYVTRDIL